MRTIVFIAHSPLQGLDVFGPVEIFTAANFYKENYKIVLLSSTKSKTLKAHSGITVVADKYFKDYKGPIDTLIVTGNPDKKPSKELLDWIKLKFKSTRRLCSVCTGAFILAESGLLKNKKATTHWMWEQSFKNQFKDVELDISSIWTKDGKVYTSAGVSTGIDLALALVEEDFGAAAALQIAKGLVLFLRRSGNQKQFSQMLLNQEKEKDQFTDLNLWLQENIKKDISVEEMAQHIGMSPRNFSRQFKLIFNHGPAEHLRKLRIEKAQKLLEASNMDWKRISSLCGMPNEALRRAFIRETGISPQDYKKRYK
ncbi:GlxA family transcriptional regulator [Peredibacter starrii]|uniref:DJ-1/PfpI family protein n=1 Tax=Peredibacter starrii TaxID=28202 RepID=A0AAX4HK91_9BACT|nr:DJ-1/PfpI family protein [Peredibacter starrii]WPU63429.1 DJ-1/PfpI family protein [Peredibacter starrii]